MVLDIPQIRCTISNIIKWSAPNRTVSSTKNSNKINRTLYFFTSFFIHTCSYHLGTLAFGSLIITIVRIIRVGLEYLSQKLKRSESQFAKFLLACLKCFFWLLETFLKFINRNAYIMCAIHGKPFCTSARDAFNLLMRNVLRVVALSKVTDFLFFMSKLLITLGMGARSSYYFNSEFKELHFPPVLIGLVMIGTYLIAMLFFSVYSMAIDTLFLCFRKDFPFFNLLIEFKF